MTERLDAVDWASLFHAEGPATDTPRRLRALLGAEDEMDVEAFVDGFGLLWTLHHEGRAWPATAPSALLAAELLDDPRLGSADPALPQALLAYLQSFATFAELGDEESAVSAMSAISTLRDRVEQRAPEIQAWTKDYLAADDDDRERMWADDAAVGELVLDQATLDCFDAVPELLEQVLPHLTAEDAQHQAAAAGAVGALGRHPAFESRRPVLIQQLTALADGTDSTHDLATAVIATVVIAIGQLGGDTRPWLADPNPGIRGCAAVAPGLAGDDAATDVLVQLSSAPRAFAASFGDAQPPHHFMMPSPYGTALDVLTQVLLKRVRDPQLLAPAVIARLPLGAASSYRSLTPYLRVAFAGLGAGARLSAVQRRLAELIAGWEGIWALDDGARGAVFGPTGLSADRRVWAALAASDVVSQGDVVYSPENVVVFEGLTGVRSRPEMFFGVGRADPGLLDGVVGVLRAQFEHAAATGQVGAFRLDVDEAPTGHGARFTVDVQGHQLPASPEAFDEVFTRMCPVWPLEYLSVAAALSSRLWVREWSDGRCATAEYVDGLRLGSVQTSEATPPRDGYEVTFEMDDMWRPLAAFGA